MAEYMENKYVAGRGTTALGIIGTALGGLATVGGSNILGGGNYVSKDILDVQMDLIRAERRSAVLEADLNTERKIVESVTALNDKINRIVTDQTAINAAQAVTNCGFTSAISVAQNNIAQLMGMTKLVIPSGNVCTQSSSGGAATA